MLPKPVTKDQVVAGHSIKWKGTRQLNCSGVIVGIEDDAEEWRIVVRYNNYNSSKQVKILPERVISIEAPTKA